MTDKIRLELIGITYNQIEAHVFAVILQEMEGNRRIPIIIGQSEAQAIECKLQEIRTPRPLTHDLMVCMMEAFGLTLREVMIKRLPNGVFAADLLLTDGIRDITIDSRSSDAIGIAVRTGTPIYTSPQVLEEAGFEAQMEQRQRRTSFRTPPVPKEPRPVEEMATTRLEDMTVTQLEKAMEKAAEEENYEEAARIKQELRKRIED